MDVAQRVVITNNYAVIGGRVLSGVCCVVEVRGAHIDNR